MDAPLILGIETATDVCSVGITRGDAVLASASVRLPRSHATRLAPLVGETLAHARLAPADLDAVAVSSGPGSYTGLRIGASLARGLCLATGARLVGVPTMPALAAEAAALVRPDEALAIALPSRRGEVFLSCNNGSGETGEAVALAEAGTFLAVRLAPGTPLALAGPAARALAEALAAAPDAPPTCVLDVDPSGARVARLGASSLAGAAEAGGQGNDAFAPTYVGTFATPPGAR